MFLFFKNMVKQLKFRYTFYQIVNLNNLSVSKQQHLCYKSDVFTYWRDANSYQQEKNHLFLEDNSLLHAVFSYSEQIYCENIT